MSMTLPSHVVAMPYGKNIALWNNHSGRHLVISKETFEREDVTPALHSRLQRFHMLNPWIPNIPMGFPRDLQRILEGIPRDLQQGVVTTFSKDGKGMTWHSQKFLKGFHWIS